MGTLTVIARTVHITPVVSDKVFDGNRVISSNMTYEWENVDGSSYRIEVINQAVSDGVNVTEEGYDIKFNPGDIRIWDGDVDITNSCIIRFETAKAFITRRTVYITTGSAEEEYDSEELVCHSWELDQTMNVGDNGLIAGYTKDDITVTFTGSQTDAGSSDNTATASIDDNFIVVVHPGTLTVNPRKIVVTLYECQSAYNGKYIGKDDITYDVTCALAGVTVDIEQIYVL